MDKIKFTEEEVIGYLETKILDEAANQEEIELYEDYKWNGHINKMNYTYKNLIMEMRDLYEGE